MKRTQIVVLVFCLMAGMTSTQLSGQIQNKVDQWWGSGGIYTNVFCNGDELDFVEAELEFHRAILWENGRIRDNIQAQSQGVSTYTGKIFDYKEPDRMSLGDGMNKWTYHLDDIMKSQHISYIQYDLNTEIITAGIPSFK